MFYSNCFQSIEHCISYVQWVCILMMKKGLWSNYASQVSIQIQPGKHRLTNSDWFWYFTESKFNLKKEYLTPHLIDADQKIYFCLTKTVLLGDSYMFNFLKNKSFICECIFLQSRQKKISLLFIRIRNNVSNIQF